jgi:hypothetical protein
MHPGWALLPVAFGLSGCSLALDFSPKAIPVDAAIDAVYTQPECDYKEANNLAAMAAVITPADVGPAAICPAGDHDFYRFTVPDANDVVTIKLSFDDRGGLGDLDLRLYDATGATVLAQSRGFGDGELITCPGAAPCPQLAAGDYLFEVFGATDAVVNRYDLLLTVAPP